MSTPLQSLNTRLAERRKRLGLSQEQLGKLLSMSRRTICAIESGKPHQLGKANGTVAPRHEEKLKRWLSIPDEQIEAQLSKPRRKRLPPRQIAEVAKLAKAGTPFDEWPLRLKLWQARCERKLNLNQCSKVFGISHSVLAAWECGSKDEYSAGIRGWEIPQAWHPLILHWVTTGKRPGKVAIAAAKAAQPNKKQPCILDNLPGVEIAKISKESTVNEVVSAYLQNMEFGAKKVAPSNLQRKRDSLVAFLPTFGEMKLTELKAIQCELWLQQQQTWKSDSTSHTALAHIRAMFSWLVDLDLLDKNPFRRITRRRGKPRDEVTEEQWQQLLRFTTTIQPEGWAKPQWNVKPTHFARLRQIMFFIWLTGARPNEARELQWKMIDWETRLIRMFEHKTANTTRGLYVKPRVIYFDATVEKLLRWIEKNDRHEGHVFQDYVFKHSKIAPWDKDSLAHKFRRLRIKAGLPDGLKIYSLRHSFATRCIRAGIDIKTVATLLGHSTTICTERYCHVAGHHEHLSAAVEKANAKLGLKVAKAILTPEPTGKPQAVTKAAAKSAEGGAA